MKYSAYLFDFDGTLVDSMPAFASVMLRILDENGIQYEKDVIRVITPLGYLGTARYFVSQLGLPLSEEEILERMKSYIYDEYAYRIQAKKNVIEALEKLKRGGASLHVLTASPHSVLDVCLKRLGMYGLFENVWSCEDFQTTKADPKIYQMAAEKIGRPIAEILFLDDNLNADKTAKEAGMGVCGVFDQSSSEFEAEIRAVSDHYIRDFGELLLL